MQAVAVMQHETRTETARTPGRQIIVDASGVRGEITAWPVKLAVMPQIMHPDFKAFPHQFRPEIRRHAVFPLGDKIERGTETQ